MPNGRRFGLLVGLVTLVVAVCGGGSTRAAPMTAGSVRQGADARERQAAFAAAADEYGVPEELLLAVSYQQSR